MKNKRHRSRSSAVATAAAYPYRKHLPGTIVDWVGSAEDDGGLGPFSVGTGLEGASEQAFWRGADLSLPLTALYASLGVCRALEL